MHRALQACCGVFCGECEVYIAYSTNNLEAQKRIAEEFCRRNPGLSIGTEQVKCVGCKGSAANPIRNNCKVRLCAEDRGVEFCYQCPDFPCDPLEKSFAIHPGARENLRMISKIGPDAWVQKMMGKDRRSGSDQ